jgi:Tol biopolymer transport system component
VRFVLFFLAILNAAAAEAPGTERLWADDLTNALGGPSADGRFLSFADATTGNLSIRFNATGEIRALTQAKAGQFAYFSAVSPDSKRIAYAWFNQSKFYELRAVDVNGANDTLLFRNEEAGFVQPCAWSPDGRYVLTLLFRKDNISQIALVPADGGIPRILKSLNWIYPKRMDISPDGEQIVYDAFADGGSSQRDIYRLAADGSKQTVLVKHAADDLFPLWSRDGKWVYFASDRNGAMGLWRVPAAGGEATLVRPDIGRVLPMGITTDNTLFAGLRDGDTDIYAAPLSGGKAERLPTRFPGRNAAPEWSPNGKLMAFLSRRGTENYGQASRVITVRNLTNGEERDLHSTLAHIERVRFSPDGKLLLASGSDSKGRNGIFIVDAGSGRMEPVATGSDASFRGYDGTWWSSGKVAYARGRVLWLDQQEIRKFDCEPRLLTSSADTEHLAFACGSSVYVLRGNQSELVRIAQISDKHPITGVRWTSAGDVLFSSGPAVFRASPDRKGTLAGTFPGSHGDIAVHPGGETIGFTVGKTSSEIWTFRLPQ